MKVLLDFHYSDDWADPLSRKYLPPGLPVVDNTPVLADSYTIIHLAFEATQCVGAYFRYVQVGSKETNSKSWEVRWHKYQHQLVRNALAFEPGLKAVRDAASEFSKEVQSCSISHNLKMPYGGLVNCTQNGVTDYDWIGISIILYGLMSRWKACHCCRTTETYQKAVDGR